MLAEHLRNVPNDRRQRAALIAGDTVLTFASLAARTDVLIERWQVLAGLRVALAVHDPVHLVPSVAALDALRARAFLVGRRGPAELAELMAQFQWDAMVWNVEDPPPLGVATSTSMGLRRDEGSVTILTSGTSGKPKAANHTWTTLAAPVRRDRAYADTRWFCAYPLTLYAGTQVLLQALLNWAPLVTSPSLDPGMVVRTMRETGVTHASGTPTFWRQLLLFAERDELRACTLRQITMGGEPVTQGLLDQLASLFPDTCLVHIYASTELGRLFSVSDGREGFPAEWLDQPIEQGIELRVVDGELLARSCHAMTGYERQASGADEAHRSPRADGWTATGDLVECRGNRVYFRGRKSDVINVGGRKVLPSTVESVLREASGVGDVRVYGKASSLVGQLVAADIVLARGSDEAQVRADVHRVAWGKLADHEIPRLLRIVEAIPQTGALKVARSESA